MPWVVVLRLVCAQATQLDAIATRAIAGSLISTDPPYYDNIGYADLSDFFYVWLRRSLSPSSLISSLHSPYQRPRNWWLRLIVMVAGSKRRAFFLEG